MEKSGSDASSRIVVALDCMKKCAEHVNDVKKRSDMALRLHQISELLIGHDDPKKEAKLQYDDLTKYGELLMECQVQQRSKGGFFSNVEVVRQLFLFETMLMVTKEKPDTKCLFIKAMIHYSKMDIQQNVATDPLAFRVVPSDDVRRYFTFKAKTASEKDECCRILTSGMLDHYKIALPTKTKQLIVHLVQKPKGSGRKPPRRSRSIGTPSEADRASPGPANKQLPRKLSSALADSRFQPSTNRLLGHGLKRHQRTLHLRHFSTAIDATTPPAITTSGQGSPGADSGIEDVTTVKEAKVTDEKPTATHHSERDFHLMWNELNVATTPKRTTTTSTPLPSRYFGTTDETMVRYRQSPCKAIPSDNQKLLSSPSPFHRKETLRTAAAAYVEKSDRTNETIKLNEIRNKVKDREQTPGAVKTRSLCAENVSDVAWSPGAKTGANETGRHGFYLAEWNIEQELSSLRSSIATATPARVVPSDDERRWTAASALLFNSDQRHSQPTSSTITDWKRWQQKGDIKRAVNDWERRMSIDEDGQKVTPPKISADPTSSGCVQKIVRQLEDERGSTPF